MEEQGYIEVKIDGVIGGKPLTPIDVDINDVKEIIIDVEAFLYPTKEEKKERPHISYKLEEGSVKNKFILPISAVILFNGLVSEIAKRGNIDFLDNKRAEIIDKFQRKASKENLTISFSSSLDSHSILNINKDTNFLKTVPTYIETEFVLYGTIKEEGGNNPNFHLITNEYGKLVISATKEQLLEGEKRLFKIYGVRAKGKQNLSDNKPFDLKLIEYITYNPNYDEQKLNLLIKKASLNWNTIPDVDSWLHDIRGGAGE